MSTPVSIPFAQGFYQSPSLDISNQQCVNFYPNIAQTGTPFSETLLGTAGIRGVLSTGKIKQANRGGWVKSGSPYFVNGTTLYRVDFAIVNGEEQWSSIPLGTIDGEERCLFADNGVQLVVLVPNGKGYVLDESAATPFQEITDTDFTTTNGKPVSIAYLDGFFVVSTDEKKIKVSAINNALSWNPLNFSGAEADPDDIVGLNVFRNQLYVIGTETTEPFANAGLAGFPFQRIQGGVVPKGMSSVYAAINTSDAYMWLGSGRGETPAIWLLSGGTPQKVSTTAIDALISKLAPEEISDCFAWSYGEAGAYFVGFTFNSITLVYDLITSRWHERESIIPNSKGVREARRWRCNAVVKAYGRILVADSEDGRIGVLSLQSFKEYDESIVSRFSTLPLYDEGRAVSVSTIELKVESGTGSLEESPEIRLRTSNDGKVFNDPITRTFGKEGQYQDRAIWNRLGRFPSTAVFEFSVSDSVKRAVLQLLVGIKRGRNHG